MAVAFPSCRKEKRQMTRAKVLIIAFCIMLLGGVQLVRWYGSTERAAGVGTASGMIAIMSGIVMTLYGLTLTRKK